MQNGQDTEQSYEIVNSADALMALNASEIDMQIATAKRYPRSIKKFQAKVLELATLDEETAASCFYALPRAGKVIKGESVRFAEIALHAFGNSRAGSRIVEVGATHVTAQATAIDLENNVAVCMEKRARITNKEGKRFNEDMITTTCNAAAAKAFRDAVFKIVPKAVVKTILGEIRKVAVGDAKSLAERRGRLVEWFSKIGVTPEMIFKKLGRAGLVEVNLDDLELMTGLKTAIMEAEVTVEDAFADSPTSDASTAAPAPDSAEGKHAARKEELKQQIAKAQKVSTSHAVNWDYVIEGGVHAGISLRKLRDEGAISSDINADGMTIDDKMKWVEALKAIGA